MTEESDVFLQAGLSGSPVSVGRDPPCWLKMRYYEKAEQAVFLPTCFQDCEIHTPLHLEAFFFVVCSRNCSDSKYSTLYTTIRKNLDAKQDLFESIPKHLHLLRLSSLARDVYSEEQMRAFFIMSSLFPFEAIIHSRESFNALIRILIISYD